MRIYTRTGDDGTTGIRGGKRVSKTDQRILAYGAVDEANASLGIALAHGMESDVSRVLTRIQNELFVVGADLSNPDMQDDSDRTSQSMIDRLERDIDAFAGMLPLLENFILPGGCAPAAHLHHSRTIVRRAEIQTILLETEAEINQLCVVYLNRLSDLLFVLGRLANMRDGQNDIIWKS